MGDLFEHTDADGDRVRLLPSPDSSSLLTLWMTSSRGVYIDRSAARKLAAALTEWADTPEPIKVGDTVVGRVSGTQYKVLAIDGTDAFVRRKRNGYATTATLSALEHWTQTKPTDD